MPTSKQAIKRLRQDKKKTKHNTLIKENLSYLRRHAVKQIEAKQRDKAWEFVYKFQKAIDKAVNKGAIHSNTAGRRKARLMVKFNALT